MLARDQAVRGRSDQARQRLDACGAGRRPEDQVHIRAAHAEGADPGIALVRCPRHRDRRDLERPLVPGNARIWLGEVAVGRNALVL